jgi:hypothetical protein
MFKLSSSGVSLASTLRRGALNFFNFNLSAKQFCGAKNIAL